MTLPVLHLHSEPYSATGNLASEGARNQLGRPKLDQLAVLVREAVQNSWDAHNPEDPHIRIGFDLVTLDTGQRKVLRENVLAEPAHATNIASRLADEASAIQMLIISDRNTSGLGGPTRADVIEKSSSTDFVDFLRNIGQPPDKPLGGGTFGYGKAALYLVSGIRCILVYTRCKYRCRLESRLMVACLGRDYVTEDGPRPIKYTGRHWWGVIDDGSAIAEPLTGNAAAELATALGIPGFAKDETGTSIAILDFLPGPNRLPDQAMDAMQTALLWNFWPKMIAYGSARPAIDFSFRFNGVVAPIPKLENYAPLGGFKAGMIALKERRNGTPLSNPHTRFHEVRSQRPRALLGWLCLIRFPHLARERGRPKAASLGGIELAACHHIALMRNAELVVKYLPGPAPTTDVLEWAGVFIATEDVDRAFAAAEPPTHDDWVSENLADATERRYVNVALRELAKFAEEFASPGTARRADAASLPLGALSRRLALLLTGASGPDAGTPTVKGPRHFKSQDVEPTAAAEPDDEDESGSDPDSGSSQPLAPVGQSHTGLAETSTSNTGSAPSTDIPHGDVQSAAPNRDIVPALDAPQTSGHPDNTVPTGRAGRPRIKKVGRQRLELYEEVGCVVVPFELRHGLRTSGTRIRATVSVEIDGNQAEKEAPAGAAVPKVLFWMDAAGNRHGQGAADFVVPSPTFDDAKAQSWQLWVQLIDDARISTSLEAEGVA